MSLEVVAANGRQFVLYLQANAHRLPSKLVSKWATCAAETYGYILASVLLQAMEKEEEPS